MTQPLGNYAVQAHLAALMAEAESNRMAALARNPNKAGLVASVLAFARNRIGSHEARSAASPA